MADEFSDLLPTQPLSQSQGTEFDDLIPRGPMAAAPEPTPAPSQKDEFADLIPAERSGGVLPTFARSAAEEALAIPGHALQGAAVGLANLPFGEDTKAQDYTIYDVGKKLEEYAKTWGPTDAERQANPIASFAGGAVGGFGGALPAMAVGGLLGGPLGAITGGAALFAGSGAGTTYNEAVLKGADDLTASKAAGLSAIVNGGLGVIPLHMVLAPVKFTSPALQGWAAERINKALQVGITFASVGEAQEFLGREIAKNFYDPEAGYAFDVNRVLGSLIGGGIIGTLSPRDMQRMRTQTSKPPTDEMISRVSTGLTREEPIQGAPSSMDFVPRVPEGTDLSTTRAGSVEALAATIEGQPGANIGRLATLLGPKLYGEPKDLTKVSVKEMVQNAFDAVKGLPKEEIENGRIDIQMNDRQRTITVHDNGTGMRPEVLANQFLQIAGTEKMTEQASGGLGIAKMLFLYGNENIEVMTLNNGVLSRMATTGPELMKALNDPLYRPKIDVKTMKEMNAIDKIKVNRMFPEGHGTSVMVRVPRQYRDVSTGEMKDIAFETYDWRHPVLVRSPLLHPISVKLDGRQLPIGSHFPLEEHTQFANVDFDWGTARIYVGKKQNTNYGENMHVLSNGLWQFSGNLKANPSDMFSDNIKRQFYVDVNPRVNAEAPGYPFDLNRQRFTISAKDDFEKIFNYISRLYQYADFQGESRSFGQIQYIGEGGKRSEPRDITPEMPGRSTVANLINAGDEVSVKDGKLIVNGREIPTLTKQQLEASQIDFTELKIPQSEIDPNQVMLHNNVEVQTAPGVYQDLVSVARERWGERFDNYVYEVGSVFKDLRDYVVEGMGDDFGHSYEPLAKEGIGISFDDTYHGVSIRIPFHASFLNIARPEYVDPERAALSFYGTMLHELAHHRVRSHGAEFPAEMQRLMINTEWVRQGLVDRLTKATREHEDILGGLNNVLDTGSPRTVGNRFKEASEFQVRDVDVSANLAQSRDGGPDANVRRGPSARPESSGDELNSQRLQAQAGGSEAAERFVTYHGSPHEIRGGFDPSKIGTGEGTATRGRGFYTSEHPKVGGRYQESTGRYYYEGRPYEGNNPLHRAALLIQTYGSRGAAADYAESSAARATQGPQYRDIATLDSKAAKILRSTQPIESLTRIGNLYTVEVKRPKDHYVDWDKPLNEQSPYVQKALQRAGLPLNKETWGDLYAAMTSAVTDARVTEEMSKVGIAGVRYLDAGSRNDAQAGKTYNYVTYKAEDLAVTHRNGEPIRPEESKAISDVQGGHLVVEENGRAIVNGREVESISPDELRGFAQANPAEAPGNRTNGFNENANAMKGMGVTDFPPTPITGVTGGGRNMGDLLFGGKPPPEFKAAAAATDHFYRKVRFLWDLRALVDANPHIEPLQRYHVELDHMFRFAADRQVSAEATLKQAWALREPDKKGLYKLIDDYVNMRYLKPGERQKMVVRRPTDAEFRKLVSEAGIGEQGLAVFGRMVRDFERFTRDMIQIMREKAADLGPGKDALEIARLALLEKNLLERPYFPITRFGLYTIVVKGPEGNKFFRYETQRERDKAFRGMEKEKHADEEITRGKLPESSLPFGGLPVEMLDFVEKQLLPGTANMAELHSAIQQLKYESSPLRSTTARFANYNLVPGYSKDFLRSYAHYFFHGSRYLSRMKYLDDLKTAVSDLRDSALGMPDGTKRSEIAQFTADHLTGVLDPRGDWSAVRAFLFHMALGFRVASAATNLTQSLISTLPHLATEFGDLKAMKAIAAAGKDVHNFYRYATVKGMSDPHMRALGELMNLGVIRGALAPELAGLSEGRNLANGYGGGMLQRGLIQYQKLSAGMFELTEQFNRRVAGMATYDLAVSNPNAKFVRKAIENDPALYAQLLQKDFNQQQAAAIVAAKVMIDRTQFQYSREYRPAYMKGPIGSTIFTFKLFTHRMLWNMYNYPAAAMRSMLIMGFLGGLQGIPGFQDLNGILKAGANWFFGKDFDLEDVAREFAVDVMGMKGKHVLDDPFTVTKGFASRGYGIPAMLDMIGEWAGVGNIPIPELDRTAAVSLNNILPVDFGILLGPQAQHDPATAFAQSVSRGMGALGSYGYNVYKAMMNVRDPSGLESFKRWEKVAPTFLANMSHAARVYKEGGETGQTGSKIVKFDAHDPEHMAEMLAMGMGYTPFRVSREWTRIRAEREATAFWDVKREMLLNQYWTALRTKDRDEQQRVQGSIRNFNKQVRDTDARGKAITYETLQRSMQNRLTSQAKQETGQPNATADVQIVRGVRRLFPGANVDVRRER